MAVLEGQEWLVVTGVGVLLFGGAWLPGFIRSLGRARAELQAAADDGEPGGDPAAAPAAPGGSAALVGPGPGEVEVRPSLDRVEPQAATPLPETVPPSESVPPSETVPASAAAPDAAAMSPPGLEPDGLTQSRRAPVTVSGRVAIPIGDVRAERAELAPVPEDRLPAFDEVATPDGLVDPAGEEPAGPDPHAVLWRRIDDAAGSARRGLRRRRR